MKIRFFALLAFVLIISACEKDKLNTSSISDPTVDFRSAVPGVLPIIDLLNKSVDGYISLSHDASPRIEGGVTSDAFTVGGFIVNNSNQEYGNFGVLTVADSKQVACKPENYYAEAFDTGANSILGNTISVTLSGAGVNPSMSNTIYAPKLMEVTSFPNYDGWSPIELTIGSEITWNADPNNDVGVGIMLEYDPVGFYNGANGGVEGSNRTNYIVTEDDGSYTFTAEDFAGFPAGMRIEISVGRGNYKRVSTTDGQYHIGIVCYSLNSFSFYNR